MDHEALAASERRFLSKASRGHRAPVGYLTTGGTLATIGDILVPTSRLSSNIV